MHGSRPSDDHRVRVPVPSGARASDGHAALQEPKLLGVVDLHLPDGGDALRHDVLVTALLPDCERAVRVDGGSDDGPSGHRSGHGHATSGHVGRPVWHAFGSPIRDADPGHRNSRLHPSLRILELLVSRECAVHQRHRSRSRDDARVCRGISQPGADGDPPCHHRYQYRAAGGRITRCGGIRRGPPDPDLESTPHCEQPGAEHEPSASAHAGVGQAR